MAQTQPIEDYYPVHPSFINHDIMHCREDDLIGKNFYSSRALGITTPYDIIQLPPQLIDEFAGICDHYDRIGLSYTDRVIWNTHFGELENYAQYEGSFFCFGDAQHLAAPNENWYRVVNYIQSQANFQTLATQLGIRIATPRSRDRIMSSDADTLALHCHPEYPKPATVLNLQYQVQGAHMERLVATEQFMDGNHQHGNRFPTPHSAWFSVEPMAKWLFSQGMRGIFAFDVEVVKDGCGTDYLPIACQPHFNCATYPILIAKKLGIPRWQTRTIDTRYRHVDALPIRELEYNPADQSGIVLVNWGTLKVGKLQLLIAGTPVQQQALRAELERCL